ncbi:MAG: PQQ-binding-like beta-propeller repeat protein [Pirellulales bacterium]
MRGPSVWRRRPAIRRFITIACAGPARSRPARGNALFAATELGQISLFAGERGEPNWTVSIGVGAKTTPVIVDKSLYVVGNDFRLFKLDTADGRELWQTPGVRQFLAQSKTHVYVLDEIRRLAILDAATGSVVASMPLPEYDFPITNPHSDQVFFVTRHGLVQELHEAAVKERANYYVAPNAAKDTTKKPLKPVAPEADPNAAPGTDPFATPPAAPGGAMPGNDPFAPQPNAPAPAPANDPFAPPPGTPAPAADPFAPPAGGGAMPGPAAPPAANDPFAPAPAGGVMPAPGGTAPAPAADPFAK